jgi:hypothetical protein
MTAVAAAACGWSLVAFLGEKREPDGSAAAAAVFFFFF